MKENAKKKFSRIVKYAAVFLIAAVAAIAGLLWHQGFFDRMEMSLCDTGEVAPGIYAIKGKISNMFVIPAGTESVCIDACDDPAIVAEGFKKLNISPDSVTKVFLTHADRDHVAGLPVMKNAKAVLSKAEEDMITGKKARAFGIFYDAPLPVGYETAADGAEFRFGDTVVRTFSTPGHTPGSMSYIVNGKTLFTGDALRLVDGKAATFFRFFTMDMEKHKDSIDAISKLSGIEAIATAHTGVSKDIKKAFSEWKR